MGIYYNDVQRDIMRSLGKGDKPQWHNGKQVYKSSDPVVYSMPSGSRYSWSDHITDLKELAPVGAGDRNLTRRKVVKCR